MIATTENDINNGGKFGQMIKHYLDFKVKSESKRQRSSARREKGGIDRQAQEITGSMSKPEDDPQH